MPDRFVTVDDDFILPSQVQVPPGTVASVRPSGGDDAAAIQAALDAAGEDDVVRLQGAYTIGSTVSVTKHLDASGATFTYTGSGTAIVVGSPSGATFRRLVHLPRVICSGKPATGWTAGKTGVKVTNAYSYEIHVPHIQSFETGLLMYGESGNGTSYANVHLGQLDNNKVNLKFDAASTGWANQNVFIGGRFSHNSSEGVQVSGVRHIQVASTTNIVNGNYFASPSIESPNVVEYHIEMFGQYNIFHNARLENTGGLASRRIWSRGSAKGNVISGGFNAGQLTQVKEPTAMPFMVESDVQLRRYGGNATEALLNLENQFSSTAPVVTVMEAGAALAGSDPVTAYAWRMTAQQLAGKRGTDAHDRLRVDGLNGRVWLGNGTAAPDAYWTGSPSSMILGGAHLYFLNDNTFDIGGASSLRPRYIRAGTAFKLPSFTTAGRPSAATVGVGAQVYDSTIGAPISSNGSVWLEPSKTRVFRGTGASDSTAFAAALSSLSAGETLVVKGTVALSATATIATAGVTIELTPDANIVTSVSAADALRVTAANVRITGGGKITSPATFDGANVQPTYAVIRATSTAPGLQVDGITLVNVPKVGIFADDTDDFAVTDCRITGNYPPESWTGTQTGHFGVAVNPSASGTSGRAVISGNIIRSCVQGVFLGNYGATPTGAYGAVIEGNIFDGCHNHGVYSAGGVDACTVTANTFTRCSSPVALTGAGHVVSSNTMFTHGTGNNLDLIGISMRDAVGCSITNNTLKGDAGTGQVVIDLGNYGSSVTISRNVISGNTIEMTSGASPAIRLGRSATTEVLNDNIVSGNTIIGAAGAGVGLITVAPKVGAVALGNKVTGNSLVVTGESHGVYLANAQHVTVQNNSVRFEYNAGSAKVLAGVILSAVARAVVTGNDFSNATGFGANVSLRAVWETAGCSNCAYGPNRHDAATGLTAYTSIVTVSGTDAFVDESGAGSPTGAFFAAPGSRWARTDGGVGTSLYVKETASTSATWQAK